MRANRRSSFERSSRHGDAGRLERVAHLVAAELEQRPHATRAVARRQRAKRRGPGRAREPVEDRLDAIVARVAGRDRASVRDRTRPRRAGGRAPGARGRDRRRAPHPRTGRERRARPRAPRRTPRRTRSRRRAARAPRAAPTRRSPAARARGRAGSSRRRRTRARAPAARGVSSRSRATNAADAGHERVDHARHSAASLPARTVPSSIARACSRSASSASPGVERHLHPGRHLARRAARGDRARRRRARARSRAPRARARAGATPARASRARRPRRRRAPASRRRRVERAPRPASSDRRPCGQGPSAGAAAACTAGSSNSSSKSSAPSAASRTRPLSSGVRASSTSPPQRSQW